MAMNPEFRIGLFGDVRREAAGAFVFERVVTAGSLKVREIGGDRAGEISAHRFLGSPHVTPEEMLRTTASRTAMACIGGGSSWRKILRKSISAGVIARRGLGPAGDGKALGFFCHAGVAIDADDEILFRRSACTDLDANEQTSKATTLAGH